MHLLRQPCPTLAASTFRESAEELSQQVDSLEEEISELEGVTVDAISLEVCPASLHFLSFSKRYTSSPNSNNMLSVQELLGHCLALLEDNSKRVDTLETHLTQFGYEAGFVPPPKPTPAEEPESQVSPDSQ